MANAIKPSEISEVLLSQLRDIKSDLQFEEIGKVLQVSDGVVRIYGLDHAEAGELLDCGDGVMAVVMNLEPDNVGAVLMGASPPFPWASRSWAVSWIRSAIRWTVSATSAERRSTCPWSARLRASSSASR